MTAVLKRLLIIFFSVLLVTVVVFSAMEITAISETEEEVLEVYEDQLSAILFSVNQYSQDVLNSWIKELELIEDAPLSNSKEILIQFQEDHPSIQNVFKVDTAVMQLTSSVKISPEQELLTINMLRSNKELISRLFEYLEAGYQKLEPLSDSLATAHLIYVSSKNDQPLIYGIQIDPSVFISEILSPRLQVIARDEMILSAYSKVEDTVVFTTQPARLIEQEIITSAASNLWLFPSHYLGVSFMDRTLNDLVEDRTRNSIIMLVIITLIIIVGVIMIIRNVEKQVRLAKMKSDFVSNVSHEIRTPLALISMYAETLEMNRVKNDHERQQFYHIILTETKRLTGLVNRILKFSKIEAGKQSYHLTQVNLNELVDEVISAFEFHLREGGFEIECTQTELPNLLLDKESVSTALFNLLDNAIKYSGSSKKIEVATGRKENEAFVKVTDYGIGIQNKEKKRIFDKLYRVEDPLVHNTKGSGLGLNLVHEITKANSGRVALVSKKGEGTTFWLYFPINKTV